MLDSIIKQHGFYAVRWIWLSEHLRRLLHIRKTKSSEVMEKVSK